MAKNFTSDPKPPKNIDSKARKMLDKLLLGHSISRDNCHIYDVAPKNSSIHSFVSYIRHYFHVPIITSRDGCDVATYYIDEAEIRRFKNPEQRLEQRLEMIAQIESERKRNLLGRLEKFVEHERKKGSLDESFFNALSVIINRK